MSDIPSDISREILRRVPVDSLFTLRSVCKLWRKIIDGPRFAKVHIHRGIGEDRILHKTKTGKLFLAPLKDFIYHKNSVLDCGCDKSRMASCSKCCIQSITGTNIKPPAGPDIPRASRLPVPCCKGLVLISSYTKQVAWVIWNPFTGESLQLPLLDVLPNVGLIAPFCGLGYDEASDDYKVVRIFDSHTYICSIYSRVWRRIEDFPSECNVERLMYNGSFANGSLHWVSYTEGQMGNTGCIVSLDLTTEVDQRNPVPLEIGPVVYPDALKLVELSGCLFLTSSNWEGYFAVWMMNDNNGRDDNIWTDVMCLYDYDGHSIEDELSLIAYHKDEKQILLRYKNEISFCYHMERALLTKVSMEVNSPAHDSLRGIYTPSSQVIPSSLVRLQRNDGADECCTSEAKSRKRKRTTPPPETLKFKICFGPPVGVLGQG